MRDKNGKRIRTYRKNARKSFTQFSKNCKKNKSKDIRKQIKSQLGFISRNLENLARFLDLNTVFQMTEKELERLSVIMKVYEQQKGMYENKIHQCEDRIVSISQPWIRPIIRGKAGAHTEFGLKTTFCKVEGNVYVGKMSFDNYNEGDTLIEIIKNYHKDFNVYPSEVLADQIYHNKTNRNYCKEHEIKFVGKKLGRKTKNEQKEVTAESDHTSVSHTTVNIGGGSILGSVYAASRGPAEAFLTSTFTGGINFESTGPTYYNPAMYATSIWTDLTITGGTIAGNVYGGGEMGRVKESTNVQLKGGTITLDAYGGGKGTLGDYAIPANVLGNTTVELNKEVADNATGCVVRKVYGCNDLNGTPKGHVLVHVYATQNSATDNITEKVAPPAYTGARGGNEGYKAYLTRLVSEATATGGLEVSHAAISAANTLLTSLSGVSESDIDASDTHKNNITNAANAIIDALKAMHDYDVQAVYGGGDLAIYEPTDDAETTEVIIEGCDVTSIKQVYGGGNAAPIPATNVLVKSCFIIDEVFGGGNGKDNYTIDDEYYENPGANVGYKQLSHYVTDDSQGTGTEGDPYKAITNTSSSPAPYNKDATTPEARRANYAYGTGVSSTTINGGHIHAVYGCSNQKGNIRSEALSTYQQVGTCQMIMDNTYGGSKTADNDAEIVVNLDCVENGGNYFGGSYKANIYSNVNINITNGTYDKIFGGNDRAGTINGSITINIQENGCTPIHINELYAGGNLAPYSIYGYKDTTVDALDENGNTYQDEGVTVQQRVPYKYGETGALTTPYRDPRINIISATEIGTIYGGGYGATATLIGSPHVNVNMTTGRIREAHKDYKTSYARDYPFSDTDGNRIIPIGVIGTIYGGGNKADVVGDTYVEIGTGKWVNRDEKWETEDASGNKYTYEDRSDASSANWKWKWSEDMTTGTWKWYDEDGNEAATAPTPARNAAQIKKLEDRGGGFVYGGGNNGDVTGNTYVTMDNGYVERSIAGGGKMGHVGEYNLTAGKPSSLKTANTGVSNVTVSGGEIGPDDMAMFHLDANGKIPADDEPDNAGHVFGGGEGTNLLADANKAYVYDTYVTIKGTAFVKGSVFGGGENGHVLHDTHVNIAENCQIGNGHVILTDANGNIQKDEAGKYILRGVNRRYSATEWSNGSLSVESGDFPGLTAAQKSAISTQYSASLPECDSWLYGQSVSDDGGVIVTNPHHAPYDIYAGADGTGYATSDGGRKVASDGRAFNGSVYGGGSGYFPYAAGQWLDTAGSVEGDTYVNVTGGHILTSLYGGCEMTSVKGDTHVTMSGGTLGVPRTLEEIDAHPVTCYIFGGGKGEGRSLLDQGTNVQNATVTVSGGLVYGSVFGGAEDGHVKGDATVTISQLSTAPASPTYADYYAGRATMIGTWGTSYVDGNIFGGGRGFDGHNLQAGVVVGNTTVNITGGTMLGSIYGGGRLGSVGTYLTTKEDTDNYGAYKPDEGTAATYYTAAEADAYNTANSLEIGDDGAKVEGDIKTAAVLSKSYGYTTINISGGVIGNDREYVTVPDNITTAGLAAWKTTNKVPKTEYETEEVKNSDNTTSYIHRLKHAKGGNVFGGSMGRLTTLSGAMNDIWPRLGQAKATTVNISGTALIKGNVYGGSEFGTVNQRAHVNITGGTVNRDVFGGGYGSDDNTDESKVTFTVKEGDDDVEYTFTPMQFAGCVGVGTIVDISGGWVKKIVYGGGEMASVGVPDVKNAVKHNSTNNVDAGSPTETFTNFGLSWPYEIPIKEGFDGLTRVNVTGGRIGLTGKDYMGPVNASNEPVDANNTPLTEAQIDNFEEDNGDVFGGGKGAPGDRYEKAYSANVTNTRVFIKLSSTANPATYKTDVSSCITGSVYGGSESGHVLEDAHVTLVNGLIGHAIYGGGKGKDTYKGTLSYVIKPEGESSDTYTTDVYGFTSGKVYGNTYVTMKGGQVMRNIYGGGNMASMGKGNYAGGPDDYFTLGYGELVTSLWTSTNTGDLAWHFLNSGKTDVKILGGTVGYINESDPSKTMKDGLPYGNVFGGARGEAVPNINVLPPYKYTPTSYSGYVNESSVTIGTAGQSSENAGQLGMAPRIYGSVYGGGQDGHVRRDATVVVNSGEIGIPFTGENRTMFGKTDNTTLNEELDNPLWLHRGNVYGSGSGISLYKFDFNHDGDYNDEFTYQGSSVKEKDYCTSAGSVTRFTQVDINGGIIHRNVYGGGSRASVGPPPNPMTPGVDPYKKGDTADGHTAGKQSQNTVNIKGTVGTPTNYNEVYGGEVYGASRGDSESGDTYSTSVWTKVHIKNGAVIKGNVFGGGDAGKVKKDTDVIIGEEGVTP